MPRLSIDLGLTGPRRPPLSAAAFHPTDPIPGSTLLVMYDAKSETGLSDGQAVVPTDSSGNARHAVQADATRQPLYRPTAINGNPAFVFDGTDDKVATPAIDLSGQRAVSLYAVAAATDTGTRVLVEQAPTIATNFRFVWYRDGSTGNVFAEYRNQNGNTVILNGRNAFGAAPRVFSMRLDLDIPRFGIHLAADGQFGAQWTSTAPINGGSLANDALWIGGRSNADTLNLAGPVGALLVYAGKHSAGTRKQIERWLARRYGVAAYRAPLGTVIFEGASNTQGTPTYQTDAIDRQVREAIAGDQRYDWLSLGVDGQGTQAAIDDFATQVAPYLGASLLNAIVLSDLASNAFAPVGGEQTVAAEQERYLTYSAMARAAGADYVIPDTLLPRSDANVQPVQATWNAKRAEFNQWLRTDPLGDGFVDSARLATIGDDGDETNTDFYNPDRVHPNVAGHGQRVPGIMSALAAKGIT